jgi:hypothetical protein
MADITITTDLRQLQALDQQVTRSRTNVQNLGQAGQAASRGMNRFGVGMQQAGYQVGDFIVQVQSGTNWMVAFGQQATQLVGILPMFNSVMGISGTALVGLSAGLGIAIPLVTAIGAAFMRTSGAGREMEDVLGDLEDRVSSVSDLLDRLEASYDDSADAASRFTAEIRENIQALIEADIRQAQREIAALGEELNEMFSVSEGIQTGRIANFFDVNIGLAFTEAGRAQREQARLLTSSFIHLQGVIAEGNLPLEEQAETLQRMRRLAEQLADMNGERSEQEDALIRQLAEAANEAFRLADETERATRSESELIALAREENHTAELRAQLEERRANLMEEYLQRRREAIREELQSSEGMSETERLRLELEDRRARLMEEYLQRRRAALQEELQNAGQLTETERLRAELEERRARLMQEFLQRRREERQAAEAIADKQLEAASAAERLADEIGQGAVKALELAGVDIESGVSAAAQAAAQLAANLGISLNAAISMVNLQRSLQQGGGRGQDPRRFMPGGSEAGYQSELGYQTIDELIEQFSGRGRGGGGGGGRSYTDIISEMEREVQQRLEILRLSERQQRVREIELEILNQIEGEVDAVTAAEIRGAAERINAIEMQVSELERLREQQEHLAQTIGNAFGDAMTSIITGTEDAGDAFRNMARRIVAELFDVLVVQRMVANLTQAIGGIGGGSSGGGGGGFLGNLLGGFLGGRASGGTMNANQPYLVGERGPEIVMPGRQSTVMNSNLSAQAMGGTQQVDVRVFVDDNGNFDAKVERISSNTIRSAAPAIVQQSVGAVVDQRRRGGAMKGVFG